MHVLGKMFFGLGTALIVALMTVAAVAETEHPELSPKEILARALPEGTTPETATGEQFVEAVAVTVAEYQELAAAIVTAAIDLAPDQASAIVTVAVQAAPDQGPEIISAAIAAAPDQAAAIMAAALEAAPAAAGPMTEAGILAAGFQIPNVAQAASPQAPPARTEAAPSPTLP